MSSSVQIYLDNCDRPCYPGQTVSGRVECSFDKQKTLRAVKIKFRGRAKTYWTESESYYDSVDKKTKTRQVHYSAEEIYFEATYNLITGGDDFSLPPGRHNYPFSYILPPALPSAYEGVHGNIRYIVTATVDRPWKFDYEAKIVLNLVSLLDLNYVPRVREPAATSTDKTLCCLWCKSGPLTFDMSLPATGYVPGQEVNIGAYVQNMSNVSVECVKFKLCQELEFIAHYPHTKSNHSSSTIAKVQDGAIGAHGEKSWTSKLSIPADLKYPNLLPCGIMKVSYRLYGEVVLPCPHTNLDVSFPFTVGHIPLTGVNLGVPGPPPSEIPVACFDINDEIIVAMPNVQPGASNTTVLINHPNAPYPNVANNNIPPYPPEKAPYPISDSNHTMPQPYSAPTPGEPSTFPGPTGTYAAYPASAPPTAPSGPPYLNTAPYPSPNLPNAGSTGAVPYPPSTGTVPYPPSTGPVPYPASPASAPPSYEEAQLKEKK